MKPRRIILTSDQCPGDILTLTAAVESLHATYPGEYKTAVRTSAMQLWDHNPNIVSIAGEFGETISCHYPSVNTSCQLPYPFLEGYTQYLGSVLGRTLRLTTNRPHVYLTDEERSWLPQVVEKTGGRRVPYWIVNAGIKDDYTAKRWPIEYYQEVVRQTAGLVTWVQVGSAEHNHEALEGVVDLLGKTDHRQFARLVYHSQGGLGPVSYLGHMSAAFEKPYVCLVGGREPVQWVTYPKQVTLHTIGQLQCCAEQACWRSRVVPLGDGDSKDKSVCESPMIGFRQPVPRCMAVIEPQEVVAAVRRIVANVRS